VYVLLSYFARKLYQVHKVISHSARIKRLRGKALIEVNGYSFVAIHNDQDSRFILGKKKPAELDFLK
jgi:hypothetical protein